MSNFKSILAPTVKGYKLFNNFSEYLQPVVLLIFRLYWGWELFLTGKGKLIQHANVVEFFTSLGIPAPELNAWFVGGLECFGGLLLLVGLASKPVAFMMSINMTVAYLSVEEDRTKVFNIFKDPDSFLSADPFFFLLMSVLVLAFGPGYLSFDRLIKKYLFQSNTGN